jgi:hypothetical protein
MRRRRMKQQSHSCSQYHKNKMSVMMESKCRCKLQRMQKTRVSPLWWRQWTKRVMGTTKIPMMTTTKSCREILLTGRQGSAPRTI